MERTYRGSSRPFTELPADVHVCRRCGIQWRDSRYMYLPGAPCRDCREVLVDEGVDLEQFIRPSYRARPKRKTAA